MTTAAAVPILLVNTQTEESSAVAADASTATASLSIPQNSPGRGGGKVGGRSHKKYLHDKDSQEYKKRRERNNVAVRKSRDKSRVRNQETLDKIDELKTENARLEKKIQLLSKELSVLKDLFLSNAESLPDPSTTFELFNGSKAGGKLKVVAMPGEDEPTVPATVPSSVAVTDTLGGSTLVVANTIELSVEGEVTEIVDGDGSIRVPVAVAEAINTLASNGHQIVITPSTA